MSDDSPSPTDLFKDIDLDRYRVKHGAIVDLAKIDPQETSAFDGSRDEAQERFKALLERLDTLQELLFAENKHRVLIVVQAMDCGGKDGVISSVFEGVDPAGVNVASFKVPSSVEIAHDYLWRVHPHVPGNGEMTIFNRSHYEDVLIVRVLELVPEARWSKRYDHIKAFEQLLVDEGTTIIKFFLHITKDEQAERLRDRIAKPQKRWKFKMGDLETRKRWDDYMTAYEDAIGRTSTADAPWYVIPANRNWYRDLMCISILVRALENLAMAYPDVEAGVEGVVIE